MEVPNDVVDRPALNWVARGQSSWRSEPKAMKLAGFGANVLDLDHSAAADRHLLPPLLSRGSR
jgi:hypothetical protein